MTNGLPEERERARRCQLPQRKGAPHREFVPEANLPKRRRAQLRDARDLLGLPQDPTDADDVHEALALIDLDERHWAAGRVEYRKATKGALRKVLSALWRLEQAYAVLPDDYVVPGHLISIPLTGTKCANTRRCLSKISTQSAKHRFSMSFIASGLQSEWPTN